MPTLIKMYYNDHHPPHFPAEYGSDRMVVDVNILGVIGGRLAPRATGLVMEWAAQHQAELQRAWQQRGTCSHSIASIRCLDGQPGPTSNLWAKYGMPHLAP